MKKFIFLFSFVIIFTVNAFSQNVEALLKKCESEKDQKMYERAVATCTEAIKLSPKNDDAYYLRGTVYEVMPDKKPDSALSEMLGGWQGKNLKFAEADYKKVVELKPNVSFNWWVLGRIQLQTHDDKEMDEPIKAFTEAIRVNSLDSSDYLFDSVYYYRAEAYRRYNAGISVSDIYAEENKMLDKAGQDALNEKRRREDNYRNLALADYTKYISLDKTNDAKPFYGRGQLYYAQRKYDLAIADLTKYISLDKKNRDVFYLRGECYVFKKQYKLAIDDYNEALSLRIDELEGFDDPDDFTLSKIIASRRATIKELCKETNNKDALCQTLDN